MHTSLNLIFQIHFKIKIAKIYKTSKFTTASLDVAFSCLINLL